VYVRSFPAFDQKRQISKEGGVQPLWRKDGRELFFLSLNARMMAVTIKPGALLESSSPGVLFQSPIEGNPLLSQYAVTGDGQRFLMMETTNGAGSGIEEFHIELNWLAALKTAAAGAK
jgi:hypothetical protein